VCGLREEKLARCPPQGGKGEELFTRGYMVGCVQSVS